MTYTITYLETSQELQMLSSVTIDFQVTKIVINPASQLSVSQMSQVPMIASFSVFSNVGA